MVGIDFTKEGQRKVLNKKPLDLLDILHLSDRVKHMGIISTAQVAYFNKCDHQVHIKKLTPFIFQGSYNFYKALLEVDKNLKMDFLSTV